MKIVMTYKYCGLSLIVFVDAVNLLMKNTPEGLPDWCLGGQYSVWFVLLWLIEKKR